VDCLGYDDCSFPELESESDLRAPCRILLQFEGLEWLMYNRTMVFDDILKQIQKAEPRNERAKDKSADRSKWSPETRVNSVHVHEFTQSAVTPQPIQEQPYAPFGIRLRLPRFDIPSQIWSWLMSQLPTFNFNDLLPIALQAKRGAIMLGNSSTPVVFTARFKSGHGIYCLQPVCYPTHRELCL
jgi:hypothetical protein